MLFEAKLIIECYNCLTAKMKSIIPQHEYNRIHTNIEQIEQSCKQIKVFNVYLAFLNINSFKKPFSSFVSEHSYMFLYLLLFLSAMFYVNFKRSRELCCIKISAAKINFHWKPTNQHLFAIMPDGLCAGQCQNLRCADQKDRRLVRVTSAVAHTPQPISAPLLIRLIRDYMKILLSSYIIAVINISPHTPTRGKLGIYNSRLEMIIGSETR